MRTSYDNDDDDDDDPSHVTIKRTVSSPIMKRTCLHNISIDILCVVVSCPLFFLLLFALLCLSRRAYVAHIESPACELWLLIRYESIEFISIQWHSFSLHWAIRFFLHHFDDNGFNFLFIIWMTLAQKLLFSISNGDKQKMSSNVCGVFFSVVAWFKVLLELYWL